MASHSSDPGAGPDGEAGTIRCDRCGGRIDTAEWYPVQLVEEGSETALYSFCSEACLADWAEEVDIGGTADGHEDRDPRDRDGPGAA